MLTILSQLRNPIKYSLGVDFGVTAAKAVILANIPKQLPQSVGAYLIPYATVGEDNINECIRLKCLKLLEQGPLSSLIPRLNNFVLCIPAAEVIIKSFSWKRDDTKGFIPAVRAQIEEWFPGVNKDLMVDFATYDHADERKTGKGHLDVLVAMTRAQNVIKIRELALLNDPSRQIIDTEWSALTNVMSYLGRKGSHRSRILLDLGASSCKMVVLQVNTPPLFCSINLQLNRWAELNSGHAHYTQEMIFNPGCIVDPRLSYGECLDNQTLEAINGEIIAKIKDAVSEIRLDDLYEVYITGGYSEYPLILEGISGFFKRQVLRLEPLRWLDKIEPPESCLQDMSKSKGAERFAVAVGLAIRGLASIC